MPELATQHEQHNHLTDLADDSAIRRAASEVAAALRERARVSNTATSDAAATAQRESEEKNGSCDGGVVGSNSNQVNSRNGACANSTALGKVCVVHCAGVHTKDSIQSLASLASLPPSSHNTTTATTSSSGGSSIGGESGSGVEAMQRTFQVNVVAPALLTSSLLPSMGAGSSVVYVGSTLSEIGVPGHLSYVV